MLVVILCETTISLFLTIYENFQLAFVLGEWNKFKQFSSVSSAWNFKKLALSLNFKISCMLKPTTCTDLVFIFMIFKCCHLQWKTNSKTLFWILPRFRFLLHQQRRSFFLLINSMTLWHNIAYMVSSFIVLLDITAMINILQEVVKLCMIEY